MPKIKPIIHTYQHPIIWANVTGRRLFKSDPLSSPPISISENGIFRESWIAVRIQWCMRPNRWYRLISGSNNCWRGLSFGMAIPVGVCRNCPTVFNELNSRSGNLLMRTRAPNQGCSKTNLRLSCNECSVLKTMPQHWISSSQAIMLCPTRLASVCSSPGRYFELHPQSKTTTTNQSGFWRPHLPPLAYLLADLVSRWHPL